MESVLIIASSGRMLAQTACHSGLMPLVIDLYADLDMQDCAADFLQVKSLGESDLTPAVDYFIERYAVTQVIYGSGFEAYPESLYYLKSRLNVLGNDPDTFAGQLDKPAFFATLDSLGIPHPELVFSPPDTDDWLLKPMRGQGGVGIKRYHVGDSAKMPAYWQKFKTGMPHSVLFLADGRDLQVIGFNRQWSVCLSEAQEFVFSGVSNRCELTDSHKVLITDWLIQLVRFFAFKGLNSLDFIHAEGSSHVLEINPRPSASMQLYAQDLLNRHVQSCKGEGLPIDTGRLNPASEAGFQIVYAECDVIIPERFEWPDGCMDLPEKGSVCHTGQPICSIIARQNKSGSVAKQLLAKQQLIFNKLERF
ncbi:MAG: ATP-grasp domain-containing protein [Methylococcaceae bacterium]